MWKYDAYVEVLRDSPKWRAYAFVDVEKPKHVQLNEAGHFTSSGGETEGDRSNYNAAGESTLINPLVRPLGRNHAKQNNKAKGSSSTSTVSSTTPSVARTYMNDRNNLDKLKFVMRYEKLLRQGEEPDESITMFYNIYKDHLAKVAAAETGEEED